MRNEQEPVRVKPIVIDLTEMDPDENPRKPKKASQNTSAELGCLGVFFLVCSIWGFFGFGWACLVTGLMFIGLCWIHHLSGGERDHRRHHQRK